MTEPCPVPWTPKQWIQPLEWYNLKRDGPPCWDEAVWVYDATVGVQPAIYVWRGERNGAAFARCGGIWGAQPPLKHVTHWIPMRRPPKPEGTDGIS